MHLEQATTLPTPTGLHAFVAGLTLDGRARLQSKPLDPAEPMPRSALEHADAVARLELFPEAPPLDSSAAHWAATALYTCARAIVDRHTETSTLEHVLTSPFPKDRGASIHWSVDLFFRHLPSLAKIAAQVSRTDPMLPILQRLGTDWPLSSVGMALGEAPIALEPILDHPALRRLYLDRLESQPDPARLKDPRLLEALRTDLGVHRNRFESLRDFAPPSPPA
jgi:hypothetical protein